MILLDQIRTAGKSRLVSKLGAVSAKTLSVTLAALQEVFCGMINGLRVLHPGEGAQGVSADTALRLERYFGSDAQGWLNLQTAYDLKVAQKAGSKAVAKAIVPLAFAA